MVDPREAGAERVMRLLLQFLDLSRDLERNEQDARFSALGGEIVYVLDENVFELFVRPDDLRGLSGSFHSDKWGFPGKHDPTAACTALIVSEYLMSGQLPGQAPGRVYMTTWHRQEMLHRLGELLLEQQRKVIARRERPDSLVKDLQRLQQALTDWKAGAEKTADLSDIVSRPWASLLERAKLPLDDLARITATAVAVNALVADELFEPLEQLKRLVSAPLRSMINDVHRRFPTSTSDDEALSGEAEAWFARLRAELVLKGRDRKNQPVWDDAKTLAYVCWAAGAAEARGQRLVLVTADDAVFDAYRRWHSELAPNNPAYNTAFCLRRWSQYAPMFNLTSAGILSDTHKHLFATLREAVEVTLLPFNLSRLRHPRTPGDLFGRQRDHLALKLGSGGPVLSDKAVATFIEGLTPAWFESQRSKLDDIRHSWRDAERIAIGTAVSYVEKRLSDRQQRLLRTFGPDVEAVNNRRVDQYIADLYHEVLEGTLDVWVPLALEFLSAVHERRISLPPRAPMVLRLSVGGEGRQRNVSEFARAILESNSAAKSDLAQLSEQLASQHHLLFALAGAIALANEDWVDAEGYCDRALRAFYARRRRDTLSNQDGALVEEAEYAYLNAMAKRFVIGDLAPASSASAVAAITGRYVDALRLLSNTLTNIVEERYPPDIATFIELRARSERAALNLFFAAIVGMAPSVADYAPHSVGDLLHQAANDLRLCFTIEAHAIKDVPSEFAERLQRQFVPNAAATIVYAAMFNIETLEISGLRTESLHERIATMLAGLKPEARQLLRLELTGAIKLMGGKAPRSHFPFSLRRRHAATKLDHVIGARIDEWLMKQED